MSEQVGMTERSMIGFALAEWRVINGDARKWATFEAVRFPLETRCVVKWGTIHSDGSKECAIQAIIRSFRHDINKYEHSILSYV